ncbi:uncharacterized protein LOC132902608 [Amyelois transitella]|uniref:uncharacterized protein LOC132902608 n=1 Tax=Amyelois transitella TaxID=680683 RepID=UPI0029905065|nr:uncharacterized protein LOC132902608 [Amyelois transitella]
MELMSSMLLCALVALLPQTLGNADIRKTEVEIKNAHRVNKNSPRGAILLNTNGIPLVSENKESPFDDLICQKCFNCMERAVKERNAYIQLLKNRPSSDELNEDLLKNQLVENRHKRDVHKAKANTSVASKPSRTKKNKPLKSASVTKYDFNGEVYALKIKESNESGHHKDARVCHIYSIKKSLPCTSSEIDGLLSDAVSDVKRKKSGRSSKKGTLAQPGTKSNTMPTTTHKAKISIFKKREADNLETPDFMPSIEEMSY